MKKIWYVSLFSLMLSACADIRTADAIHIASTLGQLGMKAINQPAANERLCSSTLPTDGDTFECYHNQKSVTVHLSGIDAPELDQPFGMQAKQKLTELISGGSVKLSNIKVQNNYQIWADVQNARGENVNLMMVQKGAAWSDEKNTVNYHAIYENAQDDATIGERGLWLSEDYPIRPSDWRDGVRKYEYKYEYEDEKPQSKARAKPKSTSLRSNKNNKSAKTKPALPKQGAAFTCGTKRTCGQMRSCAEARFFLNQCGVRRLDRDGDGRPCESLCGG